MSRRSGGSSVTSDLSSSTPSSAAAGAAPVGQFLPWDDPDFLLNPYPWFAEAQAKTPVYLDPSGTYVITRYDDVLEFGPHPAMSVEPGWDSAGPWAMARHTIIGRDDPDHARLRRQTNRWFAPKLVREWITTTAAVTEQVLEDRVDDRVDGWLELSVLPTHRTMCRVLEVPDGEVDAVRQAMEQSMPMLRVHTRPGEVEMAEDAFAFLVERLDGFLAAKRTQPGEGLTDALMAAVDRGEMTFEEMRATLVMFYGLGHMDVGYAIASCLLALAQRPNVYETFRTQPELRDKIVNEVIRLDPPELSFYRTTLEPVTIRGIHIPADSSVRFMIAAANRDPSVFPEPDTFDYTRPTEPSRILSFGIGLHSCAGQGISRAQARTVLEVVAARYRRLEVAGEVVMDNTDFSRHFKEMPLRLIP